MIRTKGAAGTGDVINAVMHSRMMSEQCLALTGMDEKAIETVRLRCRAAPRAGSMRQCYGRRQLTIPTL